MEEKYGMRLTEEETERTYSMCNLSDAIEAKGENNYRDSAIRKMLMKGLSTESVSSLLEEDIETVRKVAEQIEDEKSVN